MVERCLARLVLEVHVDVRLGPAHLFRPRARPPGADAADEVRSSGSDKLYRARSRLYRSQILQVNMRWKALVEIYTMHSFAQLCNLNFFSKFCQKKKC